MLCKQDASPDERLKIAASISLLVEHILTQKVLDRSLQTPDCQGGAVLDASWLLFTVHGAAYALQLAEDRGSTFEPRHAPLVTNLENLSTRLNDLVNVCGGLTAKVIEKSPPLPWKQGVVARLRRLTHRFLALLQRSFMPAIRIGTCQLYTNQVVPLVTFGLRHRWHGFLPLEELFSLPQHQEVTRAEMMREKLAEALLQEIAQHDNPWPHANDKDMAVLISYLAPVSHVEQRVANLTAARRFAASWRIERLVQCTGLWFDTKSVYLLAAYHEKNIPIDGLQHGGFYGYTALTMASCYLEGKRCEHFFTWGWDAWPQDSTPTRDNAVPIGSFHLRKVIENHHTYKKQHQPSAPKGVLFCPASINLFMSRADPSVSMDDCLKHYWPKTMDGLIEFLRQFYPQETPHLYIRSMHYVTEPIFLENVVEVLKARGVHVELVSPHVSIAEVLTRFEVVIWDSLGTGFLESCAVGVTSFLTPLAEAMPPLVQNVKPLVSPLFYLDHVLSLSSPKKPAEIFHEAKEASQSFFATFGKPSEENFLQWTLSHYS